MAQRFEASVVTRPRVVLADDHPEVAAELSELLTGDCDVVGIASDGHGAVALTQRLAPEVVVLDIGMPDMNGFAAANAIRASQPSSRVVFVTVQDDRAVIRRALACGARGFVLKCDAGNELVAAVRAATNDALYLSSNARRALGATL